MENKIRLLKENITSLASDSKFIHNQWYVEYHLKLVEKISMELCKIYDKADKDLVTVMVWVHDVGKMINFEKQYEINSQIIQDLLNKIRFDEVFIQEVIKNVEIIDKNTETDIKTQSIEIQIVSSADGAAHFIGPFFPIYLYENHEKNLSYLFKNNIAKAKKDWERKIVLPEVKRVFETRYKITLENNGEIPDKIL